MNTLYLIKSKDRLHYFERFTYEYDSMTLTFSYVPKFTTQFKFSKIFKNLTVAKRTLTRIKNGGCQAVIVEAEVVEK